MDVDGRNVVLRPKDFVKLESVHPGDLVVMNGVQSLIVSIVSINAQRVYQTLEIFSQSGNIMTYRYECRNDTRENGFNLDVVAKVAEP